MFGRNASVELHKLMAKRTGKKVAQPNTEIDLNERRNTKNKIHMLPQNKNKVPKAKNAQITIYETRVYEIRSSRSLFEYIK